MGHVQKSKSDFLSPDHQWPPEPANAEPSDLPLRDRSAMCGIAIAPNADAAMALHSRPTPGSENRSGHSKALPRRSPSTNTSRDCSRRSARCAGRRFVRVPCTIRMTYECDWEPSRERSMCASQLMSGRRPRRLGTRSRIRFRATQKQSPSEQPSIRTGPLPDFLRAPPSIPLLNPGPPQQLLAPFRQMHHAKVLAGLGVA